MIYLCSCKYFRKHDIKIVKANDIFILDGENPAITGSSTGKNEMIAAVYNNSHAVLQFTVEVKLWNMMRKLKHGQEIDKRKYDYELNEFLESKQFIAGVNAAFKAQVAKGLDADPLNIIIAIPTLQYKLIGKQILDRMVEILDVDFTVILPQEAIKSNPDILKTNLSRKQLKEIDRRTREIDTKYKLKYLDDTDF